MPVNKKESLIFTIMMCFFMALIMSIYNMCIINGISIDSIKLAWLNFPLAYLVAIVLEYNVISKFSKYIMSLKVISKLSNEIKPIIFTLTIICGMVVMMSLFGAIMNSLHTDANILKSWLENILRNFIFAVPLQFIIAGPLVRHVFRKIFPIGSIIEKNA